MGIVPGFRDDRPSSVVTSPARLCLIVPRSAAPDERNSPAGSRQRALHISKRYPRGVARQDTCLGELPLGGISEVVLDRGLEEVDDVLVVSVLRAIAGKLDKKEGSVSQSISQSSGFRRWFVARTWNVL